LFGVAQTNPTLPDFAQLDGSTPATACQVSTVGLRQLPLENVRPVMPVRGRAPSASPRVVFQLKNDSAPAASIQSQCCYLLYNVVGGGMMRQYLLNREAHTVAVRRVQG